MHQVLGTAMSKTANSPAPAEPERAHTTSQCLPEFARGSEVRVRGLRTVGEGHSEKPVREGPTEEETFPQGPASVAEG